MTLEAIEHLCRSDKKLARLIKKVGPCTLKLRRRTPFVALVSAVTYQQLNGTAAETILKRFIALYPGKRFPTPEDVLATPDERMRAAGLSRAKTAAIKDIAAKTVEGIVPSTSHHHQTQQRRNHRTFDQRARSWTVDRRDASDVHARPARCLAVNGLRRA